jgi:hypothetical protein
MANWLILTANEVVLEQVGAAEVNGGVMRYVFQRKEDGSFGVIDADGRKIHPASSLVYIQGNTLHVQVE